MPLYVVQRFVLLRTSMTFINWKNKARTIPNPANLTVIVSDTQKTWLKVAYITTLVTCCRDPEVGRVVWWPDDIRENTALSMFLFCHSQYWPWSPLRIPRWVFSTPHPKLRRKSAETQRINSHMITWSHLFSRNHLPFSLKPIHPLFLLHFIGQK